MQIKEVLSVGKSIQSMGTKGICVLVVNDDHTCNNIVSEMLQHCNYEVLHIGGALDVLNAIAGAKDRLDLVLTNVHKLETNAIQIVRHIQKKFNLEIILMSPDTIKIASKGQPFSFAAYVLNGLSRNAVNNLWQFALEKEKAKMVTSEQEGIAQKANMSNNAVEKKTTSSEIERFNYKSKRNEPDEKSEGVKKDSSVAKKIRVVWTGEMHQKFMEAIDIIGFEKAVPKKIVEVMGIPGLTRENVASHLQKFRGGLKRTQEIALSTLSGNRTTKEFTRSSVLPSQSTSRLNSLHDSSYFTREGYSTTHLRQSPYISNSTLQSHYLNTHNNFSFRAPERKNDKNITGLQNTYVPLSPNFKIYGDQMKNILLSVNKSSGKFVGYRLTSDGNSIEFGKLDNKISKETLDYAPMTSNHAGDENQAQSVTTPVGVKIEDLLQCPSTPLRSILESPGNDIPVQESSSTTSLIFPHDQDFSLPLLETHGNDFVAQNSPAFFEGISQQDTLQEVPQDLSDFLDQDRIDDFPFDWGEFDDTFFNHDD